MPPSDDADGDARRAELIRAVQADLIVAGASTAEMEAASRDTDADRARAIAAAEGLAAELARIEELARG